MKIAEGVGRRQRAQRGKRRRASVLATAGSGEREIKFEVPEQRWAALVEEMSGADTSQVSLHAIYQDLPEGQLARAGIGLRVRREDNRWLQTLKAPSAHALERVEDEVELGAAAQDAPAPAADLERHRSQAAQSALCSVLELEPGQAMPSVQPVFEVKVLRRVRKVVQGRSVIEVALDEGELLANGRVRPLRELELELVEGDVRDLLALGRLWRERWGLWLNTVSKAERGNRLRKGDLYGPSTGALQPQLPPKAGMGEFTAAVLHACLAQVLKNSSEIAAGSQADEHIHQLRVGLRRLRTALRELPLLATERRQLEPGLVEVFRALGERRDRTHVLEAIGPLIHAAGGPSLNMPPGFQEGDDPTELVRSAGFQDAILRLLVRAEQVRKAAGDPVRRTMRTHLAKLHRQVTRDGRRFTRLSEDDQHQVRKRLKRLRYLSEFVAPMYPAKVVDRYLSGIKPAQDALGQYNDEIIAQGIYEELSATEPGARFGVEWLQSRRKGEAKVCRKSLRQMQASRPFWKKG